MPVPPDQQGRGDQQLWIENASFANGRRGGGSGPEVAIRHPSLGRSENPRQVKADREAPAVVAKRHKVSEQTIYNWRKKFGALGGDEVRRLKQLEVENGRLKKLVAERDLEIEVMKEIAAKKW